MAVYRPHATLQKADSRYQSRPSIQFVQNMHTLNRFHFGSSSTRPRTPLYGSAPSSREHTAIRLISGRGAILFGELNFERSSYRSPVQSTLLETAGGVLIEAAVVTKLHCQGNDMGGDAESQKLVAGVFWRRKPIAKDWGSFPVASDAGSASTQCRHRRA